MTGIESQRAGSLTSGDFESRLRGSGLKLKIGPFHASIRAQASALTAPLAKLYRDYPLVAGDGPFSFHVELREVHKLWPRRRRLVRFIVDGVSPHEDMPAEQALAVLEWGMNLVIAMRFHGFLMLHSAVVERNGRAMLLPASPGHGKTTLCAALVHRGWRLLSDEFWLVRPRDLRLVPVPRPMPLKNESIEVIRSFATAAEFGPVILGTRKGDVAHVKPPRDSIDRADDCVPPGWIVFPRWKAGAGLSLSPTPRAEAFMHLVTNAFNYELLGETGFSAARSLMEQARCFRLVYSDLEKAISALTELADSDA